MFHFTQKYYETYHAERFCSTVGCGLFETTARPLIIILAFCAPPFPFPPTFTMLGAPALIVGRIGWPGLAEFIISPLGRICANLQFVPKPHVWDCRYFRHIIRPSLARSLSLLRLLLLDPPANKPKMVWSALGSIFCAILTFPWYLRLRPLLSQKKRYTCSQQLTIQFDWY